MRIVFGKVIVQWEGCRGRLKRLEATVKVRLLPKDYTDALQGNLALGILHGSKVVRNCLLQFVARRKVDCRAMIIGAL